MAFGNGISWENFASEITENTNGNPDRIFFVYGHDKKKDDIIDRIKKYIPFQYSCGKLLDIGCSIGRWVDILQKLDMNYYGVDQSDEAIRTAVRYHPKELFYKTFLWNICFDNEFDLIFCNNVLQHNTLEEKNRILPLLRRALKKDGLGLLFINESTVLYDTMTQLTYDGWIKFIESYGFKFIESWQKNDIGLDEAYLFKHEEGKIDTTKI